MRIRSHLLKDDGFIPNSRLPLLIYNNIARVPLPKSDPVYGANGPLTERWQGEDSH